MMNASNDNEKNSVQNSALPLGADNEALIQRKKASRSAAVPHPVPTPQRPPQASPRTVAGNRNAPVEKSGSDKRTASPVRTAPSGRDSAGGYPADRHTPPQGTPENNRVRSGLSPASMRRPSATDSKAASAPTTVGKIPGKPERQYGTAAHETNVRRHTAPSRTSAVSQNAFSIKDTEVAEENDEAVPIRVRKQKPSPGGVPSPAKPDELKATRKQNGLLQKEASEEKQQSGRSAAGAVKNKEKSSGGKSSDKSAASVISVKGGADMMSSIIKAIIYMVLIVVVAVFISIFVIRIGNDVFAFVKSDATVDVTIPEGATIEDISQILYGDGIIKYPSVFNIYGGLKHDDGKFIAGNYTVSPSMSYDELRDAFKEHIATGTSWITIPEGYSVDEIIDLMVENGIGERDKYIDVINNGDFDYWFINDLEANKKEGRAYRLEGYLFPDTYEFYNASSEEMVINKMLKRFDEVFVKDYKTKAAELGYSVDDILTIASLIEKEAGGAADYMYVSSVFHNRLRNSWNFPCLDSDATVVYAMQINTGVRPTTVTPDDLLINSPYNTYQNAGLPPGPITNPSASAIRYALYPASTDYYFFVSADNGKTFFASSKPEHDQNVAKVAKMNQEQD